MKTWDLIREIAKGTGFYTRNFVIFVALATAIFGGSYLQKTQRYSANNTYQPISSIYGNNLQINLKVTKNGDIIKDNKSVGKISLETNQDILNYKILDTPGTYIDSLEVTVYFESVLPINNINHHPTVAHSQTTSGSPAATSTIVDNHTIKYVGTFLGPKTIFTVHAELPKGVIKPPLYRVIANYVADLGIDFWLIFAILLPAITIITLFGLEIKKIWSHRSAPPPILSSPPEKLPPAVLGVLVRGRVGSREIAATILDLAQREYLHIYQDGDKFHFGRGKNLESEKIYELLPYEKLLLSKIFQPGEHTSSVAQIHVRLGEQLFSRKMAHVFIEIYNQVEKYGLFEESPASVHHKYKYSGTVLLCAGLTGFILNAIFNQGDPFLLLFWVGMILSAVAIIKIGLTRGMPVLTEKGRMIRDQWLGYKAYIVQIDRTKAASYHQGNADMYLEYLPSSIVLNVERDWTLRFVKDPFYLPRWFDSSTSIARLEDFANSIFPIIAFISHNLISSRTPVID